MRLTEGEARARFASVPVVRLGTANAQGRPHVVVVTFAVDGDMIYTAVDQKPKTTTGLKRLRNVGENPAVTMLADEYSDDWEALWWVRADGRAEVLADQRQMAGAVQTADQPLPAVPGEAADGPGAGGDGRALARGGAGRPAPRRVLGESWASPCRRALRRDMVFAILLVLAAALRGVVLAAYHPALIFPDSVRYLQYASNFAHGRWSVDALRQSGYSILLIPVVLTHQLWIIPLVQHLAGLATAGLVYAVLIRAGTRPALAAVAAVPVLFDPLQLVLEQYVLSDTWTMFVIVAALAILVWHTGRSGGAQGGSSAGGRPRGAGCCSGSR